MADNDKPQPQAPDAAGAATASSGNGSPADRLRASSQQPSPEPQRRGPGRPPGSKTGAGKKPEPAPAPAAKSKAPEFVYRKTGKAFKALGNVAAIQSNCTAWLVTPEEEQELGEAVGDILLELGLDDTMAAKVVFALGTVSAVVGGKAIQYAAFRAHLEDEARKRGRTPPPAVPGPAAAPEQPAAPAAKAEGPSLTAIPEAKPGTV